MFDIKDQSNRVRLQAPAKRAREAAQWDAMHGAEREAAWAQLMDEQPDVHWALRFSFHQPPQWVLRAGACLESDLSAVISETECLPLYRGFHPMDGDVAMALEVLAGTSQVSWQQRLAWLDAERAKFDARAAVALDARANAPPPSPPRCVECGSAECTCPATDDPARTDPYAVEHSGSADCHYLGAADHERLERHEAYDGIVRSLLAKAKCGPIRLRAESCSSDGYELDQEIQLEEHGRVCAEREERAQRERMERMTRANIPPPRREEERYGPRANNRQGDEEFRKDRCVWYENVTGESLESVSLTKQWERVDVLARAWRAYSDGRPGKQQRSYSAPAASHQRHHCNHRCQCHQCQRRDPHQHRLSCRLFAVGTAVR